MNKKFLKMIGIGSADDDLRNDSYFKNDSDEEEPEEYEIEELYQLSNLINRNKNNQKLLFNVCKAFDLIYVEFQENSIDAWNLYNIADEFIRAELKKRLLYRYIQYVFIGVLIMLGINSLLLHGTIIGSVSKVCFCIVVGINIFLEGMQLTSGGKILLE